MSESGEEKPESDTTEEKKGNAPTHAVEDYTPDTYTYSKPFVKRILAIMVQDPTLLASHRRILRAEYFEDVHQRVLANLILSHFDEHSSTPDWGVLDNYVKSHIAENPNYGGSAILEKLARNIFELAVLGQVGHIKAEIVIFGRHQALKRMYIEGYARLGQPDAFDTALEHVLQAVAVGQDADKCGTVVFTPDAIKARSIWRKNFKVRRVPTGLAELDERLDGGGGGGEVLMLVAPTNSGKSTLAVNIAVGAVEARRKALYYTFEQSANKIGTKMDCKVTGKNTSWLRAHNFEDVSAVPAMARFIQNYEHNMVVEWFEPDTHTINDIRMNLSVWKSKGFIPDVIIIDSPDYMVPAVPIRDEWQALGNIYNAIFTLASELDIPIWVTSDTKQSAYGKAQTSVKDIGNSYKKARKVDVIIAVGATEQEHAAGFIRLYLAKVRDGGSKGHPILVNMNWATSSWTTAVTPEEMLDRVKEFKEAQDKLDGLNHADEAIIGAGWKSPTEEAEEDAKKAKAAAKAAKRLEKQAAKPPNKEEEVGTN